MSRNTSNHAQNVFRQTTASHGHLKKLLSLVTGVILVLTVNAQLDSGTSALGRAQKKFVTTVKMQDNRVINGNVYAVTDSQLIVIKSSGTRYNIPAENIQSFTLRRKNSVGRGALIGFCAGALTGVIIGFASGDDKIMGPTDSDPWGFGAAVNNAFAMTAGQKAVAGGVVLGTTGAVVGMLIGAIAKKKFIIGGRKQKFRDLQSELMTRLVQR
ncbi:MAG TPA: hypothetical protein VFI06_01450 [Chitinophagaceae bacterium]|nr:hypothetical protein [Chitinophagaceae bacterium]